ncbi:uncharacterized protein LOC119667394 [Teleopsis dalmanni]|uniref:uncharacterized protein LOC119665560 n=1 Tax=Teleopsis dalmanni TaxID=139649 RepID=UPI0018CD4161|nr:uncharacterized protein LOC119665560 [Teleopsis dalmanni]XP_037932612.1 uncharacterized protein LOC119667394 [Teleopsis dalmanni]
MDMGHMEKVSKMMFGKFHMPHQAIIRDDHSTTKVRVVFDASAKTTNGKSLNEILHTGSKLQLDIFQLLIKWRLCKYVMTADIEKMHRLVLVTEEDQPYQTILWREDPKQTHRRICTENSNIRKFLCTILD